MDLEKKEEVVAVIEPVVEIDPIVERDEEIARLTEERDNYKLVALKRKGKLQEDDEFFKKEGLDEFIEEKVKVALADKEVVEAQARKDAEIKRITKENSELRNALKNKPTSGIGGGDGGNGAEVKDPIFTTEQIAFLKVKAGRLGIDPDKFIESARKNFSSHR